MLFAEFLPSLLLSETTNSSSGNCWCKSKQNETTYSTGRPNARQQLLHGGHSLSSSVNNIKSKRSQTVRPSSSATINCMSPTGTNETSVMNEACFAHPFRHIQLSNLFGAFPPSIPNSHLPGFHQFHRLFHLLQCHNLRCQSPPTHCRHHAIQFMRRLRHQIRPKFHHKDNKNSRMQQVPVHRTRQNSGRKEAVEELTVLLAVEQENGCNEL